MNLVGKFSKLSIAVGLILAVFGLFIYSIVELPEKGREIINFGFFISGGGISLYMFVYSATIGIRIGACGFALGVISLAVGDVSASTDTITNFLGKLGLWIMVTGVIIHGFFIMKIMKK